MEYVIAVLFFSLPILSIGLCFVKDINKTRKRILNWVLIANALLFLFPIAFAFFKTPAGENMWDENGPGAILWLYMLILPLCGMVFFTLLILKLVFRTQKPKIQ